MRAILLALLLAAPAAMALGPAAPLFVTLDLATGTLAIDVGEGDHRAMGDACSTASPVVLECTGVASPHAAFAPPTAGWLQATLYPRELVSEHGGTFRIAIEWATGTVGVRCHVPPTAQDPGALFGVTCEDFGPFQSYDWRDEPWTLHGSQDRDVLGSIQHTVLWAQ